MNDGLHTAWELLGWIMTPKWNGIPIAALVELALGGGLLLAMNRATSPSARAARVSRAMATRHRPGWLARQRARGGIAHRRGRIGVGYHRALFGAVDLTLAELAGHGLAVGGPKSGKTTFLRLLVEASVGRLPVVVLDPKGSPELAATVRALGGQVWTLDGTKAADLLDSRPWQVPDLLLEAEDYSPEARAYRDAAHQRALWAAWSLALDGKPMDLAELRRRLDRATLIRALEPHEHRDSRITDWLERLEHQRGGIEDSGARGLDRALGILLDGPALRGSLRCCPEALRLEDVIDTRGLVLFSLDEMTYHHATRKVGAWVLLAMGRVTRQLPPAADPSGPRALLVVDEIGALDGAARHLRPLVGRAREAGLAVVTATQGLSDLEAVDRALVHQVLQDTAWQLAFRQGSPRDAELVQALFGNAWAEDVAWRSDGLLTTRLVERPRVSIDEWMNDLEPGDAWLRRAPIDRPWGQGRIRVAQPRRVSPPPVAIPAVSRQPRLPAMGTHNDVINPTHWAPTGHGHGVDNAPISLPAPAEASGGSPGQPSAGHLTREQELLRDPEAVRYVWARIKPRGPHRLYWTGPRDAKGYGRVRWGGQEYKAHRVVWTALVGPLPDSEEWTLDHGCPDGIDTACCTPEHLQPATRPDNTRRRHQRASAEQPSSAPTAERFDVVLFAGVDRPAFERRTLALEDLVDLLATFAELADKRQARCWSPTRYRDDARTRGNAGVEAISALVFDCDRVAPDLERLAGVCWIGHTTWSHRPESPRWRVVIPLARPVPASRWRDVWQRARTALCPEADPQCKDPSRQYYLPSHAPGGAFEVFDHEGPLLDPATLPELPPEPERPELRRSPTATTLRKATRNDRQRGQRYMEVLIRNLEGVLPGGRNTALNHTAWTLGRWVAAGALDQRDVEDALYAAAERNGLVADDGQRACWATIRSGLGAGLQQPVDLDADH